MTSGDRFEGLLADVLVDLAPTREPDRLVPEILRAARREHRRPRWLALIKEPPMRTHARVAVGSPIARVTFVLLITLLTAVLAAGAVVTGASLLPGTTIVVAQDGSGDVTTITEAVAMAEDGHTILVKPGTYAESIAIQKDITLRGDGERGSVVIRFASPEDGPYHLEGDAPDEEPFGYGILFDRSSARVSNLTIEGPHDVGSSPAVSAMYLVGGAPLVEGIDIVLSGDRWTYGGGWYYRRSAMRISGGSTATIRDSTWDSYVRIFGEPNGPTFEGNTITGHHISIVDPGQQPVIRGNTFLEGAAIRWQEGGSGGIAEDNDITGWIGIDDGVGAANDPVIRGNRIRGGGDLNSGLFAGSGIGIAGDASPLIEGNQIEAARDGILVTGNAAAPDIRENTIRGMSRSGIRVFIGASPSISGNVIEANATGIEVLGAGAPVITGNAFCGNGTDLAVPEGSPLTLDGNTVCQPGASGAP